MKAGDILYCKKRLPKPSHNSDDYFINHSYINYVDKNKCYQILEIKNDEIVLQGNEYKLGFVNNRAEGWKISEYFYTQQEIRQLKLQQLR